MGRGGGMYKMYEEGREVKKKGIGYLSPIHTLDDIFSPSTKIN